MQPLRAITTPARTLSHVAREKFIACANKRNAASVFARRVQRSRN